MNYLDREVEGPQYEAFGVSLYGIDSFILTLVRDGEDEYWWQVAYYSLAPEYLFFVKSKLGCEKRGEFLRLFSCCDRKVHVQWAHIYR